MSALKEKLLFDDRFKLKNVLALNEKIQAIRCYEANPVYKKVGRLFNCSPDQIKRIVKNKEKYLAEWENRTKKPVKPTVFEIKTVSISILGKAVHEWIRRIMYYTDFFLNDTLIRTMAIEFARVLNLKKFTPTKEWIAQFRAMYKLPDANTKTMNIGYQESLSVQILDILRYVRGVCVTNPLEGENQQLTSNASSAPKEAGDIQPTMVIKMESDDEGDVDVISDIIKTEEEISQPSCSAGVESPEVPRACSSEKTNQQVTPMEIDSVENNFGFEIKEESDPESEPEPEMALEPKSAPEPETATEHTSEPERKLETVEEPKLESDTESVIKTEVGEEPDPDTVVINTHQGAIECVKLLEEFALLKENFRLIGLIERLEEALNEKS